MKRVIITGANGFIGRHLVRRCVEKGASVTAVVRKGCNNLDVVKKYAQVIYGNLSDTETLVKKLHDCEGAVFYHLAWAGSNGALKACPHAQLDNIRMALNASDAAKKLGCSRFLCAGTTAEYAVRSFARLNKLNGGLMYAASKAALRVLLEAQCKASGLTFVWMRLANVYGEDNATGNLLSYTISRLTRGEEATFGPAEQPSDFIHIDDLTEALYRIGQSDGLMREEYLVGTGEARPLKDYLLSVGKLMGKQSLIKIGIRADDGVRYTADMFDIMPLVQDVGKYVSVSFEAHIKKMLDGRT